MPRWGDWTRRMRRRAIGWTPAGLLMLAIAASAPWGGCTNAHDCRPGTLFLNVHFAPHTGVEQVFVEVMVPGEVTRSKTFDVRPPANGGGGVEVDFATYPK